jgi:hypothetical protein
VTELDALESMLRRVSAEFSVYGQGSISNPDQGGHALSLALKSGDLIFSFDLADQLRMIEDPSSSDYFDESESLASIGVRLRTLRGTIERLRRFEFGTMIPIISQALREIDCALEHLPGLDRASLDQCRAPELGGCELAFGPFASGRVGFEGCA